MQNGNRSINLARKDAARMCDVFLSYNSADRGTVRRIADSLRNSEIRVWFDQDEIRPGTAWIDQLEDAIETCQAAAVFVGKDGEGPWEPGLPKR